MKSWDMYSPGPRENIRRPYTYLNRNAHPDNKQVRVVPWPEGAPDPDIVPQVGEQVTIDRGKSRVYTVVNGIPEYDRSWHVWRLWISTPEGCNTRPAVGDITIYEPEPELEPERTYTEDEIRKAFEDKAYRYADTLIDTLKEKS